MSSDEASSNALQGWTSSPDGRGSLDILWTSFATVFLSIWSAICLNVPEPYDTLLTHLRRKSWITMISILGPEFLVGYALGEWRAARTSVAAIGELRQDQQWTMRHAFFANMGGFAMRTTDGATFFLDAPQILWLLSHRVVSMTQFEHQFLLDKRTIDDRNKTDGFVRVIAVAQALWFCVDIVGRAAQGLAVTTLEITVIGIVINSVVVYYFWKDKPADVQSIEIVDISHTLEALLDLEEDQDLRSRRFFRTPLEYVSNDPWWCGLIYTYMMNILHHLDTIIFWWLQPIKKRYFTPPIHPLGRRSDNDVLPVRGRAMAIAGVLTCCFLGTNFIAWNFHFPTRTERFLWRLSSSILVGISLIGLGITEVVYSQSGVLAMQKDVRRRRTELQLETRQREEKSRGYTWKEDLAYRWRTVCMTLSNNDPEGDPRHDVSPVFAIVVTAGFFVYFMARMYIIVEDFVAFRAMPTSVYRNVEWWDFVPHFG
jgi:hypothetical protein